MEDLRTLNKVLVSELLENMLNSAEPHFSNNSFEYFHTFLFTAEITEAAGYVSARICSLFPIVFHFLSNVKRLICTGMLDTAWFCVAAVFTCFNPPSLSPTSIPFISRASAHHSHGEPLTALRGPHRGGQTLLRQKMVCPVFHLQTSQYLL